MTGFGKRATFPKAATAAVACASDLTTISALLGSISGLLILALAFGKVYNPAARSSDQRHRQEV
jgi:hypothetical protein